ncbi:AraC family transcriptional regulator [Stenotrophomonas sp. ESTM1D_MKCIP4_1]|uniref:helix-turn-helix transcriptional regulator n=1 Tax=Stenotrophomonas sp. ESTM1D_MKCIP4_1 TaxID=2072414 RepID=UPI000D540507|nr:AraC family transcriptional regulator [Stenotrophomonas sp. ESTM1D_MKCIP4_1]AWH53299.1 AraC family transcriptional regulator [Stenotrophomonas sp. ESTM1D_MKCIP4_1]
MGAIFHLRHYGQATGLDRHDYAQWVLPLQGELQFELQGRGGRLDLLQGAFVAAGEAHDQMAHGPNGFVIVDCGPGVLDDLTQEHLSRQRWLHLPLSLRQRLAQVQGGGDMPELLPDLLRVFAPAGSGARMQGLCAAVQAAPGQAWPVARMAAFVGVSGSRLHALFQREFGVSPQAWLSASRLRWAKHALLNSAAPISDIALAAGYSEQSALTRALRRETGLTPSAWRRQNALL